MAPSNWMFGSSAGLVGLSDIFPPVVRMEPMQVSFSTARNNRSIPEIKTVSYNSTTTTIHWADGSKTSVRCGQGENFDKYTGFMAAVCKKLFGSTTAAKKLRSRVDEETLKAKAAEEHAQQEAAAQLKRAKREKAIVKRRAKELVLEMRAQRMANDMLNLSNE